MDKVGEYTLQVMKMAGWYNDWLFSWVKKHLGKEILEVGAGIGNFTALLAQEGRVTAIDLNKEYVKALKKQFKDVDSGFGNIESGKYFFRKRKFETVICLNVLEHIKDDQKALKEMYSLLKPKGKLILLVPAHKILFSTLDNKLGHFRRYDKKEVLDKLNHCGFNKVKVRYLNWWAAFGWFIFLTLTGWKKMPKNEVGIFNWLGKFLLWPERFISPPFGLSVFAIAEK